MTQELKGKKVAILAEELYEDVELWYPYYRLLEAGADVKIVGSGRQASFTSKHALPVVPDVNISDVKAADFDGVMIPGGYSPDFMRRSPAMIEFVREMHSEGKAIGAMCHGPWMLISAGIAKDLRATCFFSINDDMNAAGAHISDEPFVVDGNVVTSRVPKDLPLFLPALIEAIARTSKSH